MSFNMLNQILWVAVFKIAILLARSDNLVIVRRKEELLCGTKQIDRAVIWSTPIDFERPIRQSVIYPKTRLLDLPWNQGNSLNNQYGPVLDNRWESFPTRITQNNTLVEIASILKRPEIDFVEIPISTRVQNGALLIIKNQVSYNDSIWIQLEGRNCDKSAMGVENWSDILAKTRDHLGNPIDANNYVHFIFTLNYKTSNISLKLFGSTTPFITLIEPNIKFHNNSIILVNSGQAIGYWKVHNYNYYVLKNTTVTQVLTINNSSALCLSMYAAISMGCELKLLLYKNESGSVATEHTYVYRESYVWQRLVFTYKGDISNYVLYAKLIAADGYSPRVALHEVRISDDCLENDMKYSCITNYGPNLTHAACRYLVTDKSLTTANLSKETELNLTCPLDSKTWRCASCSLLSRQCQYSEICRHNEELCYCKADNATSYCDTQPNPVTQFDHYALNPTTIYLRWYPPHPATGQLERYKIVYHRLNIPIPLPTNYDFAPEPCTIWPWLHCISISNLYPAGAYIFQILAKNKNVATWSTGVMLSATLITGNPDTPTNLTATWDRYYNLTLNWNHPNRVNGILSNFRIDINNKHFIAFYITVEKYIYTHKMEDLPQINADSFTLTIVSVNEDLKSSVPTKLLVDYPPPTPELSADPIIIKKPNKLIDIIVPKLKEKFISSFVYIVVQEPKGNKYPIIYKNQTDFIEKIINKEKSTCAWIAKEFKINENTSFNLTLGDNTTMFSNKVGEITNWPLPLGVKLKLFLVVVNDRKKLMRFTSYSMETSLRRSVNPAIYACTALLWIPIALCIYQIKKRKVRFTRL